MSRLRSNTKASARTTKKLARSDGGRVTFEVFATAKNGDDLSAELAAIIPERLRWSRPDSAPLLCIEADRVDILRLRSRFLEQHRGAEIRIFEVPFAAHEKWAFASEPAFARSGDGLTFVIPGNPALPPVSDSELHAILIEARDMLPALRVARYKNIPDFVLREGRSFSAAPLTGPERDIVRVAWGKKQSVPKACFGNARRLVLADPTGSLAYVEGYISGMIHHAWAALGNKVVDPTFHFADADARFATARRVRCEYIGVPLCHAYVATASRDATPFLDDWKRKFPILNDAPPTWRAR